ncbi:MAG TPA: indolepyruvate ferredoxin oxidoreductase subunit alpha [Clostridia bacterium]|nr:indolepyruvate ferredoxin oxidoreductase subunit alpha [Clostridia bacterium]
MRELLTGNEAIARGAYEAGCLVAAAYPGTPSTEILENLANYREIDAQWSPNEKVAVEIAGGAAIGGVRALAAMKHVGLNVAADPLMTLAYSGIKGGLVIVTADDPGAHSSQNEQDNRHYASLAKVIMLEPSDSQECKDFTKMAFALSEQFDLPVLIRVTTRICHSKSLVELGKREVVKPGEYKKDVKKYVMVPAHARLKHYSLEAVLQNIRNWGNYSSLNKIVKGKKRWGIITAGIAYQYAREVFGEEATYLKLGLTHPLPEKLLREFAKEVEEVIVIEENDPYLETRVKALGIKCQGKNRLPLCGELTPDIIRGAFFSEQKQAKEVNLNIPTRPPVLCAGCPHRGLFYALKKFKEVVVAGDIGCYTLGFMPPLEITDTVICMGASISGGIGLKKALPTKKVFSCLGDSTFFHSGITGLIDVVYNQTDLKIVILDNRTTAMTGHQDNPGTGKTLQGESVPSLKIVELVKAVGVKKIRVIDPYDLTATEKALQEAYQAQEPFVIISKRPCALLKEVRRERRGWACSVDPEKCTNCRACLRLGCPALVAEEKQVVIDSEQCNGCGLCAQVCRFGAISRVGEKND